MASIRHSPTSLRLPQAWRGLVPLGIGVVIAAAWTYLACMAWGMAHMDVSGDWLLMPRMSGWDGTDLVLVFVMWALMMAAMMLPSAVPLLLLLNRSNFARYDGRRAAAETAAFVGGYLATWTGFSAAATLVQWGLLEARLVSSMMESSSAWLSGALLLAAGAYQFSAAKDACLSRCRSPLGHLLTRGKEGGFALGLRHGAYCAGCCWLLMALMFVLGVMNLAWIGALTLAVLLEKVLRRPRWFTAGSGAALLLWGVVVIAGGAIAT